jgi:hypothetical protein
MMKRPPYLRWLFATVPVVLIVLAFGVVYWMRRDAAEDALHENTTYEVWLAEAEVTPVKRGGDSWDADGSAPDLKGVIVWQNQRILETVTAVNGLIAQWEPVAVKLTQVLHGEADAASVRRVARVRLSEGKELEVGVFDDDPARPDLAGAFRVPWSALRPGVNEIQADGMVRRLRIVIIEPGGEVAKMPFHRVTGAEELASAPAAMNGMLGGMTQEATAVTTKAAGQLESKAEALGRKAGNAAGAVKNWLKPAPKP